MAESASSAPAIAAAWFSRVIRSVGRFLPGLEQQLGLGHRAVEEQGAFRSACVQGTIENGQSDELDHGVRRAAEERHQPVGRRRAVLEVGVKSGLNEHWPRAAAG